MPSGGRLTVERFQQRIEFGMSDGFEAVHYLVEELIGTAARTRDQLEFPHNLEHSRP